jgi:4-diphosphocytidyl-2-C-methyl-D-erythritol kinase
MRLTIDGPFAAGLSCTDNLVIRAADAIGVVANIRLEKTLPVASGIGGGSADAAATLRLLARISGHAIPSSGVQRALGADVPACVVSQTSRGEGAGERLTPVAAVTGTPVLLVNPRVALSTAAVFGAWDGIDHGPLGDWRTGRNDLEGPARALVPEIGDVLSWLTRQDDVMVARMSGSGATCFALFGSTAARDRAAAQVPAQWWQMASVLR